MYQLPSIQAPLLGSSFPLGMYATVFLHRINAVLSEGKISNVDALAKMQFFLPLNAVV